MSVARHAPALLAAGLVAAVVGTRIPAFVPDSDLYIATATDQRATVPAPFSQRVLHPWSAELLAAMGPSVPAAFTAMAVVALVLFCVAVRALLAPLRPVVVVLTLTVPFLVVTYQEAFLPDLVFATALAGLLLALRRESWWAVPPALVVMFTIRESTLLVGVVLVAVLLRRGRRSLAAWSAVASVVGYGIGAVLATAGQPTRHGVAGPLYLLAKLPYNGIKNLTGIELSTSGAPRCVPVATFDLPTSLGNVSRVGLCPFDPLYPTTTLVTWLTLFGLAPAVLAAVARHARSSVPDAVWVRIALWTGLIAFVIAPLLGATVRRLVGYGWPAMLVVAPLVLFTVVEARVALRLVAASWVVAWLPSAVGLVVAGTAGALAVIAIALPAQLVAHRVLRRALATRPPPDGGSTAAGGERAGPHCAAEAATGPDRSSGR